jgi:hypothetical protein
MLCLPYLVMDLSRSESGVSRRGNTMHVEYNVPGVSGSASQQPEDDILHSQCRENLKSYIALTGWAL